MGIFDKIQSTTAVVTSADKHTTSIGENCAIFGDVSFDKTIEIHGKITGTVKIAENCTTAMLIVKKSGVVEGDVFGDEVVIEVKLSAMYRVKENYNQELCVCIRNVYYDILDMNGATVINGNLIRNKEKNLLKSKINLLLL